MVVWKVVLSLAFVITVGAVLDAGSRWGSIFADDASRRLDYDKIVEPVDIVICRQDLRWNLCGQRRDSGGGKWKRQGIWKAGDISRVA